MKNQDIIVIVHNIRSTYNVGSMFRTADAAGVSKIYLTGYTPSPVDRFGRYRRDIAKTALGAEKSVPWEHYKEIGKAVKKLKKEGFYIIALEQVSQAIDYKKISAKGGPASGGKQKTALVVGNEVRGLSKVVLDKCDVVVEIPMRGKKESLNVGVALGIALFRILNI